MHFTIENDFVRYIIGADGCNLHFVDKSTGTDYCHQDSNISFVRVKKADKEYQASSLSFTKGKIIVQFGDSGISAVVRAIVEEHYIVLEVLSISTDDIDEFVFVDLPLTLKGQPDELFAGCALALNLQTNVHELPGANNRLRAVCYKRFGLVGAKVALIGCPQDQLRSVMQEVVSAADELPHSPIGGPWALDAPINRGSYIFQNQNTFDGPQNLTENNVDDWIRLLQDIGFTQFYFQTTMAFSLGDFKVNTEFYPRGPASLKAVVDKLHRAGISACIHSFAFLISKSSTFVTPVPHPDLGKDATFTLAESLTVEDTMVQVLEPTQEMSTIVGGWVRNSVTLQIDNELITYSGICKKEPYAFTGCKRGACGTKITPHARGAKVHHLKEFWGQFTPECDSALFIEVASRTADLFNKCGFDGIYFDALDGEDILAGKENGWYYGSKFVFEVWNRLKKPALMEMATFHHHLWFVRSRNGAADAPMRGHKRFVDIHCKANEERVRRMFLPECLGWWRIHMWDGVNQEPNFSDVIEYLCCKCLATDSSCNLEHGIDPETFAKNHTLQKLAGIMKRYENLRLANYFPESIKTKLRVPKAEFTLNQNQNGQWQFRPIQYTKHKIECLNACSKNGKVNNRFGQQPLRLRIQALLSMEPYDAPGSVTLIKPGGKSLLPERTVASGVTQELQFSSNQVKVGSSSLRFTATNSQSSRQSTWAMAGMIFTPPKDLSQQQGLGVWIYGDGQGEMLNFQMKSPKHISVVPLARYVIIDFIGWRYFELVEPEGERLADYQWPQEDMSTAKYLYPVDYGNVTSFSLWYNNLPANGTATCYLSPVKALPLVKAILINPSVKIDNTTIVFPTRIESGCYLEFYSTSDCKLYNPQGELICEVTPEGDVPLLKKGENDITFTSEAAGEVNPRLYVTIISQGELLEE